MLAWWIHRSNSSKKVKHTNNEMTCWLTVLANVDSLFQMSIRFQSRCRSEPKSQYGGRCMKYQCSFIETFHFTHLVGNYSVWTPVEPGGGPIRHSKVFELD